MLVDICHDHPVSNATAFPPASLQKRKLGSDSGPGIAILGSWPQFDLGIEAQNLPGIIARSIVIDDVPLNEFVIMQKKEGQQVSLIPTACVKVYFHNT